MPVQQVVIRPGMDESLDARYLPIGTPRLLQNIRVRHGNRFEKRPGMTALGRSGLPVAGYSNWLAEWNGLATFGVQDTVNSQVANSVYIKDASNLWNYAGRHGFVVPERRVSVAMDGTSALSSPTCVAIGGLVYVAWAHGGIVHLVAMDPHGMAVREATLASADDSRLVYTGGVLYLITRLTTGLATTLEVRVVTLATLALSAAVTIGTLGSSTYHFDAAAMEGASSWLIAYAEGATTIRVRVMTGTGSTSNAAITTTGDPTRMGIAGVSGGKVVVTYIDGTTDAEVSTFSDTLTGAANVVIYTASGNEAWFAQSAVVRTGSAEWALVYSGSDQSSSPAVAVPTIIHARVNNSGVVQGSAYKVYRFCPASKPFVTGAEGSRRVSLVVHDALQSGQSLQSAHHIIDLETEGVSGGGAQFAAMSYEHQPRNPFDTLLADVASLGSGQMASPICWQDPNDIEGLDLLVFRSALTSESLTWGQRTAREVSGALVVTGGALYEHCAGGFTGDHYIVENGFVNDPIVATVVAAGGSLTTGVQYSYRVCYAWLDSLGNRIHRSAPSAVNTVTPSGGNLTVTVRAATLGCSGRFGTSNATVVAEVYRAWNGGPYYYCGSTGSVLGSALSVTFTDNDSDTTVSANRTLYTDAGIIANDPPSGARLVCVGAGRVFTVGWKPRVVEFSKLILPTTPAEFCDDNAFRIFFTEELTALAYLDGALVAFSAKSIFVVTGDGPNDQGVGSFSEPRRLPCAIGSDSPHVVETPEGIMFMGAGTIWLLPRGLGPPVPVGDAMQDTIASRPECFGMALCSNEDDDLVHFCLGDLDPPVATTRMPVYDHRLGTWTRDTWSMCVGAVANIGGYLHVAPTSWLTGSDDPVRKLDPDSTADYSDDSATTQTFIESAIGSGDWRPAGPLGCAVMRSFQIHGEVAGVCSLVLSVTVDGGLYTTADTDTTYTATKTFASTGEFYLEHQPIVSTGTSWRFDLLDALTSAKNAGIVIHAVAFEFDVEQALRRVAQGEEF